jgi:tRNA modification GTPase
MLKSLYYIKNWMVRRLKSHNIVAIATANGYAGVGIIRISGIDALEIAYQITHHKTFTPRLATYTKFYSSKGEVLDSGLVIYFKSPNSFTGEDIVELQGHGSPIALQMIIRRCLELGCHMAEPGEFSRRAYLNGKIDLVQAESIIDLIHAESEATAKGALKSLHGEFSRQINIINEQLIDLRMFVEATLDFPEEDIEFIANAKIRDKLTILVESMEKLLSNTTQGVLINNGANIVIIGRPNVGKSSLLNALANEDIAIVTDIAGTTRDIVKEKIIINGIAFNIIDTAGIRDTTDIVEKIGIERAFNAANSADICLVLVDATIGVTASDTSMLSSAPATIPKIFVHNKVDLLDSTTPANENLGDTHIYISAKAGTGIDTLRTEILATIGFDSNNSDVFIARTRHLDAIRRSVEHIHLGFHHWNNLEILAEELRYAHNSLSEITGEFSSDDLLGEIFSRFCIGK